MLKSWLHTLFAAGGVALVGFLTSIATARGLGPEGRGVLASAMLVVSLSAGFAQLGLGQAFVYQKRSTPGWPASQYFSLSVVIIALLASSLGLLAPSFPDDGGGAVTLPMVLLGGLLALNAFLANVSQLDASLVTYNLARLFLPLGTLVCVSAIWWSGGLTVSTVLWAQLFVGLIVASGVTMWVRRTLRLGRNQGEPCREAGVFWLYLIQGVKYHSTIILGLILTNVDKAYLFLAGNVREFGLYSVVFGTSRLMGSAQEALSTTLFSRLAGNDKDQTGEVVLMAFRLTFLPMLILAVVTGMAGSQLLRIAFGPPYDSAALPFAILLVECVIGGGSWVLSQHFNATGRPGLVFLRQASSILPLLVLLPFIPADAILMGLAVLLLLSAVIRLAVTLALYPLILKVPIPRLTPIRSDLEFVGQILRKYKPVW